MGSLHFYGLILPCFFLLIWFSKPETSHGDDAIIVADPCYMENWTFNQGEKLTYKVYYNLGMLWLAAGEVEFELVEDDTHYYSKVLGRTYKNYESIYKVHDIYESKIDKRTLLPSFFLRNINEGSYQRYDSIFFNQQEQTATSYWGRTIDDIARYEYDFSTCMQDMLSIMYYVRNIDFTEFPKGANLPVHIFFDKETYNLDVEYDGIQKRKKIKHLGNYSCFKIIPEAVKGHVFKENTKMKIWISNDGNRIPLQIESPLIIGSVKAVLKESVGLKHPLTEVVN